MDSSRVVTATLPENIKKNRYKNVLAYDSSRVVLEELHGKSYSDYVNASYIDGFRRKKEYIASQGPSETSKCDFWRMVWQKNVQKIVMVTDLVESNKIKCFKYWPDHKSQETLSDGLSIECTSVADKGLYMKRKFQIKMNDEKRDVKQLHYKHWPDKTVPRAKDLLTFLSKIRNGQNPDERPLLIHCSAGAGRTGVLIAVDIQMQRAEALDEFDVFGCVHAMRNARPWMIQTAEQYQFIYECLLEWHLNIQDTFIPAEEYNERLKKLMTPSTDDGVCRIEELFGALHKFVPEIDPMLQRTAREQVNLEKNRDPDIVPLERVRPSLMTISDDASGTDYINASFCNDYKKKNNFLTTQMPMPNTVVDIWRLIYDFRIASVVMLNAWQPEDTTLERYWPEGEEPNNYGFCSVSGSDTDEHPGFTERNLLLREASGEERMVKQFQLHEWPNVSSGKEVFSVLLELMKTVHDNQMDAQSPLLVHCLYGNGASGVFVALMKCQSELKETSGVDAFYAVKELQSDNPCVFKEESDFELLHVLLKHLLEDIEGTDGAVGATNYQNVNEEKRDGKSMTKNKLETPAEPNTKYQNVEVTSL